VWLDGVISYKYVQQQNHHFRRLKMRTQLSTIRKSIFLLAFFIAFCLVSAVVSETTVNAEEGVTYVGNIFKYNPKLFIIQFEHNDPTIEKKILYFSVTSKTVVLSNNKPVVLSEVWQKTKKARMHVVGPYVQRIDILEWQ
jgi:hypothetical protein